MLKVNDIVEYEGKIFKVVNVNKEYNYCDLKSLGGDISNLSYDYSTNLNNSSIKKITLGEVLRHNVEKFIENDLKEYLNKIENEIYNLSLKGIVYYRFTLSEEVINYIDLIIRHFKRLGLEVDVINIEAFSDYEKERILLVLKW